MYHDPACDGMASGRVALVGAVLCCLVGSGALPAYAGAPPCSLQRHHPLHESLLVRASCAGLELTSVPASSLPPDVTSLDLRDNELRTLPSRGFARFRALRSLDVSGNAVSSVDDCGFAGLAELRELVLSRNDLSDVDAGNAGNARRQSDCEVGVAVAVGGAGAGAGTSGGCGSSDTEQKAPLSSGCPERQQRPAERKGGAVEGIFASLARLQSLDLSRNRLGAVSSATFSGLRGLQRLDLSGNRLAAIRNDTFGGLPLLRWLDLSQNGLSALEPGALAGLPRLADLNLKNNEFADYGDDRSFPPSVFRPVASSLTSLAVTGDAAACPSSQLPDAALGSLTSLQRLTVNKLARVQFGSAFTAMKSLSTLDLTEDCYARTLTNDSFSGLNSSGLTSLLLEDDDILYRVDTCAFCPLRNLRHLSLRSNTFLGVEKALLSLHAFVGRNLSVVDFHHVVAIFAKHGSRGTVLEERVTSFLLQTCVSSLILSGNDITGIRLHSIAKRGSLFNRCIQHIDLSDNYIMSVNILEVVQFYRLSTDLRSLQWQDQNICSIRRAVDHDHFGYSRQIIHPDKMNVLFPVPPLFEFLNGSGTCSNVGVLTENITFSQPNRVKVMDLSYAYISICVSQFNGLGRLESLNLSRSSCQDFRPGFFDSFPSLTELSLQTITIDPDRLRKYAGRLFRNVPLLRRFDFSFNRLRVPLDDLLRAQRDLRELRLAGNLYSGLPLDLGHHPALSFLDLSQNDISHLSLQDRGALDRHVAAAAHGDFFSLSLRGNPIACTCDTLPFVRWLGATRVRLDRAGNYSCVTDSGAVSSTGQVLAHLDREWRRCVGADALWAAVVGTLLLLTSLGVAWAAAANATRIRFFLTTLKRIQMPRREQFHKDAYLSYCDADTELAVVRLKRVLQDERNVQLLIKDLPVDSAATRFYQLPGDNVVEKMLEHIDMCWKVVVVLTEAMSRDEMAGLMMRAALQGISDRQPERVVLLCVGLSHVPDLASLRALLQVVPERQVVFVPRGAGNAHPTWDVLADVIMN